MRYYHLAIMAFVLVSCNQVTHNKTSTFESAGENKLEYKKSTPNILFIIADDMGKDAIKGFSEGSIKPRTPNIDQIRTSGLSFENFWTYPTCSPTRASMLTGKYGYRTDVRWANQILDPSELILQRYIKENTDNKYATAVIGKWHVSGYDTTLNPESFGLDYYAGLFNGSVKDYYNWPLTEDGYTALNTEYTTTKFTDLAINWIDRQDKPWFVWLAYNAPHTPFHLPPNNMHSQGDLPAYTKNLDPIPYFMASIEAMDFQIGRLLATLSEEEKSNTIIIFMGDNGTEPIVSQHPYGNNQVKRSLYQGGINMPLFVSGKGVTRRGIDSNLITSTDIFATLAHVAGVNVSKIHDSKSFTPLFKKKTAIRKYQYSEMKNEKNDAWTISNGMYKLLIFADGTQEFYDLENDPYEKLNLLSVLLNEGQKAIKTELEEELLKIRQ